MVDLSQSVKVMSEGRFESQKLNLTKFGLSLGRKRHARLPVDRQDIV